MGKIISIFLLFFSIVILIQTVSIPIKKETQYVFYPRNLQDMYTQRPSLIYSDIFDRDIRFSLPDIKLE